MGGSARVWPSPPSPLLPDRLGGCGTWVLVWGCGCWAAWVSGCWVVVVCVRGLGGGVMVVCVVWLAVGLVVVALVPPGPLLVFVVFLGV